LANGHFRRRRAGSARTRQVWGVGARAPRTPRQPWGLGVAARLVCPLHGEGDKLETVSSRANEDPAVAFMTRILLCRPRPPHRPSLQPRRLPGKRCPFCVRGRFDEKLNVFGRRGVPKCCRESSSLCGPSRNPQGPADISLLAPPRRSPHPSRPRRPPVDRSRRGGRCRRGRRVVVVVESAEEGRHCGPGACRR